MKTHKKVLTLLVSAFAVTMLGVPVFAVTPGSERANAEGAAETTQTSETAKEQAATRLAENKLRVCQNREKAINANLGRIAERGQKQLNLFTTIATRTEKFYTEKGKTLSTYADLVAQVDAKKASAEAAVVAIRSDSNTFKCDGANPKGAVANFKTALKAEIAALKEYKTAVKNLIVGVKSVQGTTSSTEHKTAGGNQ